MFLFYSLGGEGRKNSFVTPPRRLPATQTRLNFAPPGHGCMYLELPKMMVSRCPPPSPLGHQSTNLFRRWSMHAKEQTWQPYRIITAQKERNPVLKKRTDRPRLRRHADISFHERLLGRKKFDKNAI